MNATVVGALIGGGVVLVGTFITSRFQFNQQTTAIAAAKEERIAARTDAHAVQIRLERVETYLGLINGTGRLMRWVDLTAQTLLIERESTPNQLTEEEQWQLNARVNVLGSKEVGERLRTFNVGFDMFTSHAAFLDEIIKQGNPRRVDLREHFDKLRELQTATGVAHASLVERIRLELGIDEAGEPISESDAN